MFACGGGVCGYVSMGVLAGSHDTGIVRVLASSPLSLSSSSAREVPGGGIRIIRICMIYNIPKYVFNSSMAIYN